MIYFVIGVIVGLFSGYLIAWLWEVYDEIYIPGFDDDEKCVKHAPDDLLEYFLDDYDNTPRV